MGGGGQSKAQASTNNQVAQQQLAMQQQQLGKYNDYVNQLLKGGGYLPGVGGALRSQAIQGVPQQYNQIAQQLRTQLGERGAAGGGSLPGGGLYGAGLGSLYSGEEQQKSNLLNNITAQGQQNIAAGEGGILNAAGLNSSVGSSALGSATTAAGNADQNAGGLFGTLIGAGLGAAGTALSGGLGAGGIFNKPGGCWVARAVYGEDDWRPIAIWELWSRKWMNESYAARLLLALYIAIGEPVSLVVKRSGFLQRQFRKLFDRALIHG